MYKRRYLEKILRSPRTVFTTEDISSLWDEPRSERLRAGLHYYVKSGELIRVRRGIYAKDQDFNRQEMATCLYRPSYISYETALLRWDLFLYTGSCIHVASYLSRQLECGGCTIRYHKVRRILLYKSYGLDCTRGYPMAAEERAILDTLRRDAQFKFTSLSGVDWEILMRQLPWYRNQRLHQRVRSTYRRWCNSPWSDFDLPEIRPASLRSRQHELDLLDGLE